MNDMTKTLEALREAAIGYADSLSDADYNDSAKGIAGVIMSICDRALAEAKGWKDGVPDALKIKEPEAKPEVGEGIINAG